MQIKMVVKMFILAFAVVIWEADSQNVYDQSIKHQVRPSLTTSKSSGLMKTLSSSSCENPSYLKSSDDEILTNSEDKSSKSLSTEKTLIETNKISNSNLPVPDLPQRSKCRKNKPSKPRASKTTCLESSKSSPISKKLPSIVKTDSTALLQSKKINKTFFNSGIINKSKDLSPCSSKTSSSKSASVIEKSLMPFDFVTESSLPSKTLSLPFCQTQISCTSSSNFSPEMPKVFSTLSQPDSSNYYNTLNNPKDYLPLPIDFSKLPLKCLSESQTELWNTPKPEYFSLTEPSKICDDSLPTLQTCSPKGGSSIDNYCFQCQNSLTLPVTISSYYPLTPNFNAIFNPGPKSSYAACSYSNTNISPDISMFLEKTTTTAPISQNPYSINFGPVDEDVKPSIPVDSTLSLSILPQTQTAGSATNTNSIISGLGGVLPFIYSTSVTPTTSTSYSSASVDDVLNSCISPNLIISPTSGVNFEELYANCQFPNYNFLSTSPDPSIYVTPTVPTYISNVQPSSLLNSVVTTSDGPFAADLRAYYPSVSASINSVTETLVCDNLQSTATTTESKVADTIVVDQEILTSPLLTPSLPIPCATMPPVLLPMSISSSQNLYSIEVSPFCLELQIPTTLSSFKTKGSISTPVMYELQIPSSLSAQLLCCL